MNSIQKNFDNIDWGGTNTSSNLFVKSVYAGVYLQHKYFEFLITVLEYFNCEFTISN